MIPQEYTSILQLYFSSFKTSGATNPGVPHLENNLLYSFSYVAKP